MYTEDMPFQKEQNNTVPPKELEQMSKNLQNYVRGVFGLVNLSRHAEEELWNRLTPDEQMQATEIAKRMIKRSSDEKTN